MNTIVAARRRGPGFTLIETMIVVAMIAIMMAIAVPSFRSFIGNYRATTAINDLLQGVTLTRAEALKRGQTVTMAPIGGDWRNGWIVFVDVPPTSPSGSYQPAYDPGEVLIFQHDPLPPTITVSGPVGGTNPIPFSGANYVAFNGSGYPRQVGGAGSALSGGLAITDNSVSPVKLRTLCLAAMGRPRIVRDTPDTCSSG